MLRSKISHENTKNDHFQKMFGAGLFVLVTVFHVSKSQAPIPNRIPGFSYDPDGAGFSDNAIEVEVFVDLQCPDCKMAWATLKQMASHYGKEVCISKLYS